MLCRNSLDTSLNLFHILPYDPVLNRSEPVMHHALRHLAKPLQVTSPRIIVQSEEGLSTRLKERICNKLLIKHDRCMRMFSLHTREQKALYSVRTS